MDTCTHLFVDREDALADGMCALCLAAENERLREAIKIVDMFLMGPDTAGFPVKAFRQALASEQPVHRVGEYIADYSSPLPSEVGEVEQKASP